MSNSETQPTVSSAPLPAKTGYAAMKAWNESWKQHHLPMWAKKAIRLNAIKRGNWRDFPGGPVTSVQAHLPSALFDHWGSIEHGETRAFVTQPYGNHDKEAAQFAAELGWSVKSSHPGPWHPETWCYEFLPGQPS